MSLNIAALRRYVNGTIPAHTREHDKAAEYPEYRDNLDLAFKFFSLGIASGADHPLGTAEDADIRLLEIFPHATGGGRIRCAIHHYCFLVPARRISYSALSYVWGNGKEERLIVINGKGFLVSENLQNILWHLREKDRSVYVWIDAICIYQAMEVEKQVQIGMMTDIYSTADNTIIFFGEEANESDLVAPFLELLRDKLLPLSRTQPTLQIGLADLATHGLPSSSDPRWKALRRFLEREWFSRKWCIQECALAKSITCHLGLWTFDFDLLLLAYELSLQHGLDKIPRPEYIPEAGKMLSTSKQHGLFILGILRRDVRRNFDNDPNAPGKNLPWLLAATNYAKISMPKDAIYSLLGIYQVFNSFADLPYPAVALKNRSVKDVFIDYACIDCWKTNDKDTSLLEIASMTVARTALMGEDEDDLHLPSWVPRWDFRSPWEYILHPGPQAGVGAGGARDRSAFTFNRNRKTLQVRAALFDTITSISDVDSDASWDPDQSEMERTGYTYLNTPEQTRRATTAKGHIAMVMESAKVRQSIFIICGERLPFVLKKVPGKAGTVWKLAGGAYVRCIMNGEGLDASSPHYVGGNLESIILV